MDLNSVLEALEDYGREYSSGLSSGVEIWLEHSQLDAIVLFHFSVKICHIDFLGCPTACIFMRVGSSGLS